MDEDELIKRFADEYKCDVPTDLFELTDFLEVMLNNIALRQDISVDKYTIELVDLNDNMRSVKKQVG